MVEGGGEGMAGGATNKWISQEGINVTSGHKTNRFGIRAALLMLHNLDNVVELSERRVPHCSLGGAGAKIHVVDPITTSCEPITNSPQHKHEQRNKRTCMVSVEAIRTFLCGCHFHLIFPFSACLMWFNFAKKNGMDYRGYAISCVVKTE